MSAQTITELERMCEALELQRAQINGELLTGYLPDGAAVEYAVSTLSLGLARRVAVAATEDNAPGRALELFLRRLNRHDAATQWEIRRRDRPRGIEAWLLTMVDRDECNNETETIRTASTHLAQLAENYRRTIQVLSQQRVATILQRYLSDRTSAGDNSGWGLALIGGVSCKQ